MKKNFANPYLAGFLLGLTLLVSYVLLGVGLGASAGPARAVAAICDSFCKLEYFTQWGDAPLRYYLVAMFGGTFLGGLSASWCSRRMGLQLERGENSSRLRRAWFALFGGILVGFASRLAMGCTSGQALSGGALLVNGSLVFMMCVFIGGYGSAFIFRRQWQ